MPKSATSVSPSSGEEDVLGLHVPVDDAVPVRVVQRARRLMGDPYGVVEGKLVLALEPVSKGLPFDVRHGKPEEPGRLAGVMDREDMRVLEAGGELDLAQETVGAQARRELGV